ncbi:hypothetical protein OIDMADRAFT_18891 [Oidiodendron maius Zn]|uniref:Uncharacterized protein n=1 Tax=Oidiodendron maius (strain Zn) TaxID=913774 RepID=A0A0C3HGK9_OIDMZ|nr:hypothetical protein OIDMADRAFT_18891 [Oidiodendron maius Zn]
MSTPVNHHLVTLPLHCLLRQVAEQVLYAAPDAMITIDTGRPNATWSTTIAIAADALQQIDQKTMIFPEQTKERRELIKKMALENPIPESHFPSPSPSTCSPIRTRFAKHLDPPQSTTSKEALRKMAKEMMELPYRQPYHIKTRARYTERVLPVVSGHYG